MATYSETLLEAQQARENALASIHALRFSEQSLTKDRTDYFSILFGTQDLPQSSIGILHLLVAYYSLLYQATGRVTSKPDLRNFATAKQSYLDEFELSLTDAGDGPDGFYPPDPDDPTKATKTFNLASPWILTNDLSDLSTFSASCRDSLDLLCSIVGRPATANSNGRGPYSTYAQAQAAAAAEAGSGLLGRRTQNSLDIYSVGSSWYIGTNGLDYPNDFTTKSDLLSSLNAVITSFDTLLTHLNSINTLLTSDSFTVLDSYNIPRIDDSTLDSSIALVSTISSTLTTYITYFNQVTSPTSQTQIKDSIDSNLLSLSNDLFADSTSSHFTTPLQSFINDLESNILSLFASTVSFRALFGLWISYLIGKQDPLGCYLPLRDLPSALETAQTSIELKDILLFRFLLSFNFYFEIPSITIISFKEEYNIESQLDHYSLSVYWSSINGVNKYKLLYRPFDDYIANPDTFVFGLDPDDPLVTSIWITSLEPNSTRIQSHYTITYPLGVEIKPLLFSVIAYDTDEGPTGDLPRTDSFNSSSIPSLIMGNSYSGFSITVDSLNDLTQLTIPDVTNLLVNTLLYLSFPDPVNESSVIHQIAHITKSSSDVYLLDRDYSSYGTLLSVDVINGGFIP